MNSRDLIKLQNQDLALMVKRGSAESPGQTDPSHAI
jgi:hypothetical protein